MLDVIHWQMSHVNWRQARVYFDCCHKCLPRFSSLSTHQQANRTRRRPSAHPLLPYNSCCRMAISGAHKSDGRQSCSSTPTPPPSPLSINRLLALHPRERLLVHPLRWTDRQPALLDCRIHDHDEEAHGAGTHESTETTKTTDAVSSEPDAYPRFLARRLCHSFDDGVLADTVLNLIWPLRGRTLVEHKYVRP